MRLNLKINSDREIDPATKLVLINQNEITAVTVLISNANSELRTLLLLKNPKTIEDATSLVINYSLLEQQVNIRYQNPKPLQRPTYQTNKPHQNNFF